MSGQQHGMVALDGAGEVVRPAKLWCDTDSAPEAEELGQGLPLVHFSSQPEPFFVIETPWNSPTHRTNSAHVKPKSGM